MVCEAVQKMKRKNKTVANKSADHYVSPGADAG
jgi:hypothetical protein